MFWFSSSTKPFLFLLIIFAGTESNILEPLTKYQNYWSIKNIYITYICSNSNTIYISSKIQNDMEKCASSLVTISSIFQKWWTFLKATWIDWKYFRWTWWILKMLGFGQSPFQLSVKVNMMHHQRLVLVQCQKLGMWQLTPTKQESRLEIQA